MRKGLKKSAVVILLVFLLLCAAVPAFAQDAPKPFCGKLAADDCELLASAQEAAKEIGSGTYNSEINFKLAGVPGLPVKEISFNLTQDASYALDPELSAQLADMQTMTPEEMAKNMEKMVDLLLEVYGSLSYDGVMNLTLPKDIADLLSAQAGTTVPEEIQLQIRIVDGYGYLNLEDLAAFNPPNADQLKGWAGLDLLSIMKTGLQQSLQQGAVDTSQLGPMAGLSIGNLLGSEENRALLDPYVGVERQRDDTIDDQDVAVIQTTFNMGGFVGSPLFRDLVISQLPTINQLAETDLTEQQVTESLTMLSFVGPMLFTGLDLHTTRAIGLDDFFVHQNDFVFDWDLSSLIGVAKMVDSDGKMGLSTMLGDTAPVINLEVSTSISDQNDIDEITAPEDAQIIDPAALQ